jgi:outer membrane murein-binding lipoprotein Lpp
MAWRHGLPVLLFACLDAQCLAAGCATAAKHNRPSSEYSQGGAAFRAALIPGHSTSEASTKARVMDDTPERRNTLLSQHEHPTPQKL